MENVLQFHIEIVSDFVSDVPISMAFEKFIMPRMVSSDTKKTHFHKSTNYGNTLQFVANANWVA